MGPEREPTPEDRQDDLIYLAEDRQLGREVGRRLEDAFDSDTMTGLSFFLPPEGSVYVAAVFDPEAEEQVLRKARAILSEFCQESPVTLDELIAMAFQGKFPEVYMGAASAIFLEP
jgi:hypothetical protein